MAGGKATPRHDKGLKIASGELVKTGKILSKALNHYKPGVNIGGLSTLYARCDGKIYFSKKKTSHGKVRTFINIKPV